MAKRYLSHEYFVFSNDCNFPNDSSYPQYLVWYETPSPDIFNSEAYIASTVVRGARWYYVRERLRLLAELANTHSTP